MSKNKFNPLLASALWTAVFAAGTASANTNLMANQFESSEYQMPAANAEGEFRYIIRFKAPALAAYRGTGEMAAPARLANGKLDVKSPAAKAYVNQLKQQQDLFTNELSAVLGRSVNVLQDFQHAYNGVSINLKGNEVALVKSLSSVSKVIRDKDYYTNTDAGPQLIGADNIWLGNAPASGMATGDGMVIGTLDTGVNFDHSSFAAMGGDGFVHVNPLGSGNFLGVCDSTNVDQYISDYTCNDKLIGGFDFVNQYVPADGSFDIVGPEDENGHGSHTASTSGGNNVTGDFSGITGIEMNGVAKHATHIMFDVCYNTPTGQGTCPGVSSIASVDQAISDGLVDVINFSIGGGGSPWTDPVSEAFLNATDSGIFVTTSAGNSGPGASTLGHVEPWTTAVGSMTHNRRFSNGLDVTGAEPVPANLIDALAVQGTGPAMTMNMIDDYGTAADDGNVTGCTATGGFSADLFLDKVALISRGGCGFLEKVDNATAAGATGVVVYNSSPAEPIIMGALETTTIPAVMIGQQNGLDMETYLAGDATAGVDVAFETSINLNGQADTMSSFSSRGPSPFEYNKPDVGAPGQSILAAYNDDTVLSDGVDEYNAISGTSMASPHTAGAATLLKQLKPNWTPMEVKSALMMTAKNTGTFKEDGTTPTDLWDLGAGRIQVDVASSTGLVMHASAYQMLNADPANGGDPKTINAANLTSFECIGTCNFERKLRSVASTPVTYDAALVGMPGTVNPSQFTVNPGQTVTLDIEIDGGLLSAGAASMGELMISQSVATTFNVATNLDIETIDSGYDGTLGSMLCETISVSGITGPTFTAEVDIEMSHSWPGDLSIKLLNPADDVLGLMSRPGLAEAADDGNECCGSSTPIEATSVLSFKDAAVTSAEDLAGCAAAGTCEISPAPETIVGVASLQDLSTGSANGDWELCVGDSGGGDFGFVTDIKLNIVEGAATLPNLHMPVMIVGFPDAPEIDVTPTSLAATLDADMSTDLNVNIANLPAAGADLNWAIGSGSFSVSYIDQINPSPTTGFISGTFAANGGAGFFTADDFTLTSDAVIENMRFEGFANGTTLDVSATGVSVYVYADDSGVPQGNPEDGLNLELVSYDLPIGDVNLDTSNNYVVIDVVGANGGSGLDLPAGTYWVTVVVDNTGAANDATRWNWFAAGSDVAGSPSQSIAPQFGVLAWEPLKDYLATPNPDFEQMSYSVSGSNTCGASWMSTSSASGVLAPGSDEDVTVTLDSTGLAPGVYTAGLCIDSDDLDEAQTVVSVTLTVDGPSDLIFENGFEAP